MAKLKQQIVEGVYPPGCRLPTRDQLQVEHNVSAITVQRALNELGSERFIKAYTRRGTFVVDDPPHLTQFAIVFNQSPNTPSWSQFDLALANEAGEIGRLSNKEIHLFYGVDTNELNENFVELRRRVLSRSLAGMIFSDAAWEFHNTPLLNTPGTPRVVLAPEQLRENKDYEIPAVSADYAGWMDKALNYLISHGHRRIAFVSRLCIERPDRVLAGLRERGMETRPHWIHAPSLDLPAAISNCVNMLMRGAGDDRPDALVIDDDHYVEMATTGLLAAGIQTGDQFRVVAHGNYPWLTKSVAPVTRLGFDVRQILHACLDLLDRQRRGEPVPLLTKVAAVFEDELKTTVNGRR